MVGHWCGSILLGAVTLAGTQRLPAQALATATGSGAFVSVGIGAADYRVDYGQRWLGGGQAWVDANPAWWSGLEVEARSLTYNRDLNAHASTLLVGPRISISSRAVEPYVKALVGRGQFFFPYGYATGSYFVIAGGGGIDWHVGRRFQVRLPDVEYQSWPRFTYGDMSSFGASVGVSYSILGGRDHRRRAR